MRRVTATWTTGVVVTALLVLPVTGWGQTSVPAAAPAQASPQSSESEVTHEHQQRLAQEHLRQAHAELAGLRADTLPAGAHARVAELKRHLSTLQPAGGASSSAVDGTTGEAAFTEIDSILTELLGPEPAGTRSGVPVGTSGDAAGAMIDDTTRSSLQKVRTHLTAYAAAARGAEAATGSDQGADAASPSASAAPPTGESATATTSPTDPTPTPTGRTATSEPHTAASPEAGADAADSRQSPSPPPFDGERMKQHLSAAREALAQMTRLPAAAEISGTPRAQVSQLITDFNEMIASGSGWRTTLAKVKANLQTILAEPAAANPADDATGTEVVGTSGRSDLDPEIRIKLLEFRTHLQAFEEAVDAGARAVGAVSSQDAEPMDPAPTTTPEARDAPRSTVVASRVAADRRVDADDSQRALAGASGRTTHTDQTAQRAAPADRTDPTPAAASADRTALQHIEAIEGVLAAARITDRTAPRASGAASATDAPPRPVGTSGTTTAVEPASDGPALHAEQVAEIRTHLRQLRQLLVETRGQ